VLVRLGDPRLVPCFCCTFPLDMPSSTTAGSPLAVCAQFLSPTTLAFAGCRTARHSQEPHHPLQMGRTFAASLVRYSLRPAKLLATLADLTGYFSQPTVTFTSRLSTGRSSFPSLDITTVALSKLHRRDFHPLEHQLASLHLHHIRMTLSFTTPRRFNRRTGENR
jgi:hypothetical protein